ncbi:DUF4309 domain-containing protein [Paenibacillus rigui]|uniref:DUF4309 domain-containing protein n=1 Tax=Paenibacillus rigui TaxID=554312 RepID=UPI0015C64BEF|nr:DUF4309 domain-containing protein [Paenibacillus rigui]
MKKFLLGLLCGTALTTATAAAYSSDTVQAYLFPAKYVIDGQPQSLDKDYATLNYEGHAYVPARWVAESLGRLVKYDQDSRTIAIDQTSLSKKLVLDPDFLSYAAKGQIRGIEFGIDTPKETVLKQWGEPHKTGTWQVPYSAWFDYYYFFANPGERVSGIRVGGNSIPYTVDEVKKALGKPRNEGINDVENGWYLFYEAGAYQIFFNADDEHGAVRSLTLKSS